MSWILLIVVFVVVLSGMRTWRHSRSWGYSPGRGLGMLLVTVTVFLVLEYIPPLARSQGGRTLSARGTDSGPALRTEPSPAVGEDTPPAPVKPPEESIAPSRLAQPSSPIDVDGGMDPEPI